MLVNWCWMMTCHHRSLNKAHENRNLFTLFAYQKSLCFPLLFVWINFVFAFILTFRCSFRSGRARHYLRVNYASTVCSLNRCSVERVIQPVFSSSALVPLSFCFSFRACDLSRSLCIRLALTLFFLLFDFGAALSALSLSLRALCARLESKHTNRWSVF